MRPTEGAYALFVLVLLAVHRGCRPWTHADRHVRVLLGASLLFYLSWDPGGLVLLAVTTALVYGVARTMPDRPRGQQRLLLAVGVAGLLAQLLCAKYRQWPLEVMATWNGMPRDVSVHRPTAIGLSFYTLAAIGYLVDLYRGMRLPAARVFSVGLFLAFFPALLSGPIVRARHLLPQLGEPTRPTPLMLEDALARIVLGLAKKCLVAETLGSYVDAVFSLPQAQAGGNVVLAVYAYAFQLYFDFSGYTDVAIGVAMLFGVRLPENFDRPYAAASVREFWQRWHMSLSTWLRDYVYVSLVSRAGPRPGVAAVVLSLVVTMGIGGLWHGASATFLAWGLYQGALLGIETAFGVAPRPKGTRAHVLARQVLTFHLLCLGLVVFRADSFATVAALAERLSSLRLTTDQTAGPIIAILALSMVFHLTTPTNAARRAVLTLPPWGQGCLYAVVLTAVATLSPAPTPFIYLNF